MAEVKRDGKRHPDKGKKNGVIKSGAGLKKFYRNYHPLSSTPSGLHTAEGTLSTAVAVVDDYVAVIL